MDKDWVALQLSDESENQDPKVIVSSIHQVLPHTEVFIPAITVNILKERSHIYLVDGYAFIRYTTRDSNYFKLEGTHYVKSVITSVHYDGEGEKTLKIQPVKDAYIKKLREQLKSYVDQGIEAGDTVLIVSGPYKNISAQVITDIKDIDQVQVRILLRSKDTIVTLPRSFLVLESKKSKDDIDILTKEHAEIRYRLGLYSYLRYGLDVYLNRLRSAQNHVLSGLSSDIENLNAINELLCVLYLSQFDEKMTIVRDYILLRDTLNMIDSIYEIENAVQIDDTPNPVNIVIDGMNLLVRCGTSPGLRDLTSDDGQIIGGLFGFLNSIASYKRTYPISDIWVAWDESSARRRAIYPDYKANRTGGHTVSFELSWLKDNLSDFGVHQVLCSGEEADDVIATLVRSGSLNHPNTVIVSNDKDLFQLVADNVRVQTQAGLVTVEEVRKRFGVTPGNMPHYRALAGDPSDNIPGVVGCGDKTVYGLLSMYQTVGAVLNSNLAGVSSKVRSNLRNSEGQIKINLQLAKLVDNLKLSVKFGKVNAGNAENMLALLGIKPDRYTILLEV